MLSAVARHGKRKPLRYRALRYRGLSGPAVAQLRMVRRVVFGGTVQQGRFDRFLDWLGW